MNILYGVSGEGLGHATRALAIGAYLKKRGHKLLFVSYGGAYEVLNEKFPTFLVHGPQMIIKEGTIKERETIVYNLKNLPRNFVNTPKFRKLIKNFKPDMCISDFDVFVPILSYFYNIPLIAINNQLAVLNTTLKVPNKYYKDYLLMRLVTKMVAPKANHYIVVSLADFKPRNGNTTVVSPTLRQEVLRIKPKRGKHVLVYISKKSTTIAALKKIDQKFIVYGFNKKEVDQNLTYRTRETFVQDVASCRAIIATAGFSLLSEAIYLNKPYFALPIKGHFEQMMNAMFLKKAGFGTFSERLTKTKILKFLENLTKYEENLKKHTYDPKSVYRTLDKLL